MVGVDLQADANVLLEIETHVSRDTAHGLRERDGRSAMQDAHRLHCAMVHGHRGAQKVGPHLDEANTQVLDHSPGHPLGETFDRERSEPDAHRQNRGKVGESGS